MDQYTDTQYDDDLTLGTEDYDDSYYADAEDLFAFAGDDESPISRLRSLVLSIDWEITDEVLTQFNQELVDLKDIWAGEKVNLVYVQALEKISKYIYQKKADAHPNAIKLLLSLYYNLEKIVSDHNLSDIEKHELLTEDVRRFDNLKKIISKKPDSAPLTPPKKIAQKVEATLAPSVDKDILLKLKAIVLGIDWEITDQDLTELKTEVLNLEKRFSTSRPKLILLQGIGTLGAYIKVKKSNAHADAFKVLHLFYESLEKIVLGNMSLDDEKAILFPAVEKFNEFKSLLGPTISPDAISRDESDDLEEDDSDEPTGSLSPALSDFDEAAVVGFQEEEEAKTLETDQAVVAKINDFFRDDSFPMEEAPVMSQPEIPPTPPAPEPVQSTVNEALNAFDESFRDDQPEAPATVSADLALQGVDVEYDDDDEEEETHAVNLLSDEAAPAAALSFADEDTGSVETTVEDELVAPVLSAFDETAETAAPMEDLHPSVAPEIALQGVAVETEADDDSDLEALPRDRGGLAPALLDSEEESIFSSSSLEQTGKEPVVDKELSGTLENFFGEEEYEAAPAVAETTFLQEEEPDVLPEIAPAAELEEPPAFVAEEEPAFEVEESEDIAPALAFVDEETIDEEESFAVETQMPEPVTEVEEMEMPPATEALELAAEEELAFADEGIDEDVAELTVDFDEPVAEPEIAALTEEAEVTATTEIAEEDEAISLESELDEQIDDIFADIKDEEPALAFTAEDEAERTPEPEPTLAAKETEVEAKVFSELLGEEEEEVVFELCDEDEDDFGDVDALSAPEAETGDLPVPEAVSVAAVASAVAAESLTTDRSSEVEAQLDAFFPEEEEVEKAPFREASDEEEALPDTIGLADAAESEGDTLFTENLAVPEEISSPFQNLLGCVESIALELDDKVIAGLFGEINILRQQSEISIAEKMLLQLLSTVTQHIDNYRYEASAESFNLLKSISATLAETSEEEESVRLTEMMHQTVKVLQWQQDMLHRQVVVKGETLTFSDPLRKEDSGEAVADAQQEFDSMLDRELSGENEAEQAEMDDFATESLWENKKGSTESFGLNETEVVPVVEKVTDQASGDFVQDTGIRAELAKLRKTLQQEIAQLRDELFKK